MTLAMRRKIRISGVCLMIIYLSGLFYFLFFAEQYGRGAGSYGCNLLPFREICRYLEYWEILGMKTVVLNLAGNVVGFMPLGVLLPVVFQEAGEMRKTVLICFELSILVETAQLLFHVGSFDVDDILLNTLGGIAGYMIFALANLIYCRKLKKTR